MADAVLNQLSAANAFDLRGVVAVVTGGGSGIGLMISSTLLANGATVYIIGPKQADLDRTVAVYNEAAERTGRSGRMYGLEGDIRSKLFICRSILDGVSARPVANTAEAFRAAYFDAVSQEQFDNSLRTNAVGPYWFTFAFLPLLEKWKKYEGGSRKFAPQVIMTSSMNGWTKDLNTAGRSYPYMFSKAAIGQATATLANELLPLGLFETEMTAPGSADAVGQSRIPEGVKQNFEVPATQPPLDVGSLALFLVGNWFVNGETVLIDGGTMLVHLHRTEITSLKVRCHEFAMSTS
ncbi:NAD-P-binding protein [Fomitopsis serialis]|uniref:NAD-P-binding protein n=1 Tax=Fomitopsis serialis TaxID=139415 RepID=UPI002007BC72|nr:NAD-P-binding protein [Neoantrodia serialis]KAH9924073.1 NAD-P-binding protein [Neoantrodia serialis]